MHKTSGNIFFEQCKKPVQPCNLVSGLQSWSASTREKSSTKDMVHLRRAKGYSGVAVSFTKDTKLNMKKGTFLSNSTTKQQFINMLSCFLERNCKVYRTSGDADVMIIQKAVEIARVADTVLVGDDTDILVLLCYHACFESHNIFFKPGVYKQWNGLLECGILEWWNGIF